MHSRRHRAQRSLISFSALALAIAATSTSPARAQSRAATPPAPAPQSPTAASAPPTPAPPAPARRKIAIYVEGTASTFLRPQLATVSQPYFDVVMIPRSALKFRGTLRHAMTGDAARTRTTQELEDAGAALGAHVVLAVTLGPWVKHEQSAGLYLIVPTRAKPVTDLDLEFFDDEREQDRAMRVTNLLDWRFAALVNQTAPPPAAPAAPAPAAPGPTAPPRVTIPEDLSPLPTVGILDSVESSIVSVSSSAAAPAPVQEPPPPDAWVLVLGAGAAGGTRQFDQTEPSTGRTRSDSGRGIFGYALSAELRPIAVSPRVSLVTRATFWQAIEYRAYDSVLRQESGASSVRADGEVRARIRVGSADHPVDVGVGGGVARWTGDFDVPSRTDEETPTADYDFVVGGVDVEAPLPGIAPLRAFADASALSVFHAAALGDRAVAGHALGADVSLGLVYSLVARFALRASAEYTRFGYTLLPAPGAVASPLARATDQYWTFGVMAVLRF
ncbi:MAG TPA: hypothetical protein VHV30_08225 [Polyangiaceae bacterium]|jgi:hypothetical protein|nr:hypothetical protein [Polyangiaceae bacterium]